MWQTSDSCKLSSLCSLENLGAKGVGCAKLLNARTKKLAETVMLAVPPATATLKTAPGAKDRVLVLTFHLAMLHEVRSIPLPRLSPPQQPAL